MTFKWSEEAKRLGGRPRPKPDDDKPRKPRGNERVGHEHESLMLTGMFVSLAGIVALAFAWWIAPFEGGGGDGLRPADLGNLLFAIAALLVVAAGFWLILDIRTPILLMSGPGIVGLILGSAGSLLVMAILPAALCFPWAGLAGLERHRIDRWVAVVAAAVLAVALGSVGILFFSPVAIAAAFIPMLKLGPNERVEVETGEEGK